MYVYMYMYMYIICICIAFILVQHSLWSAWNTSRANNPVLLSRMLTLNLLKISSLLEVFRFQMYVDVSDTDVLQL